MKTDCEIKKIGGYLTIDAEGYIVNTTSKDLVQPLWKDAVEEIVAVYKTHYGDGLHSVYVRGSVACGAAIEGISDLDTIAIVARPNGKIDRSWVKSFQMQLMAKYPFIKGVEMQISPLLGFEKRKAQGVLIKTQSICLYGENLADLTQKMKPGSNTIQHLPRLEEEIEETLESLKEENVSEARVKHMCSWIMKRIVRSGFELVMERSHQYTRDLYPCYEGFSKYYGDKEKEMYAALELVVCPTTDKEKIEKVILGIGGFVVKEYTTFSL